VAAAEDTTASYPTATTPPAAGLPYAPPTPAAGGGGSGGGSKRGLVIGGAILAAIALAVVAFLALSGDDDEPTTPVADESEDTTTTEDSSDAGEQTLEDLEDACADGDFRACDDLYFSADIGSELEDFGSTCGGITDPQSGECEATNGGEESGGTDDLSDGNLEDIIADSYEETLGLSRDQAECLAGKITDAIEDGSLTEEQAFTEVFDYLSDCDISLDDITESLRPGES
jgi:hypothetical protein